MKNKFAATVLGSLTITACASTPSPHLKTDKGSLLQTRVSFLPSCPGQTRQAQRESLAGAAAAHLIAPLIDTAYDAATAAIVAAGNDETESFSGQTVSRFYSTSPKKDEVSKLESYELFENQMNNCLVIIHGYFSQDYDNVDLPKMGEIGLRPSEWKAVQKRFGLAATPKFYYEGNLFYSAERSAFRIKTARLYYPERLIDHKTGHRKSTLFLTFSKPGASLEGSVFAAGKIDIDRIEQELKVHESPINGIPASSRNIQTAFGTSYMPLPALSDNSKTALSTARTRLDTHATAIKAYVKTAKKIDPSFPVIDPHHLQSGKTLADKLEESQVKNAITGKLDSLKIEIKDLQESIQTQTQNLDTDLIKAKQELEDIEHPVKTNLAKARRNKARAQFLILSKAELAKDKKALTKKIELQTEVKALANAARVLKTQHAKIRIETDRLRLMQPFTITAKLTETRFGNPVAKFIGTVLTGSKEGLTTELKERLDPIKRKELEEQAKQDDAQLQTNKDTARKNAITAVYAFRTAEVTLATLPLTATENQRLEAEKTHILAQIDAENACRDAEVLGVAPSICSAF